MRLDFEFHFLPDGPASFPDRPASVQKKRRKPIRSVLPTLTLFGARRWNSQFFKGYNFAPRPKKCQSGVEHVPTQNTRFNTLKIFSKRELRLREGYEAQAKEAH